MKTTFKVEKNILSLDELYNIFDSELYKDAKLAFVDDPFAQRNTQLDFTQLSADRLKNAPLLYRHIIAERILLAEDEEINNAPMRNYDPELILRLCYLWMHPITRMENPEREGLILMNNAQISKETKCNLAFREKDIKRRFNRLANLGILYFAENFENCFLPDETIHNWDYITLNLYAKYNEIVEDPEITLERAISYVPFDIRALRYSILRIIAPRCGGKRAAEILKKLQSEWNFIKLCDYDNFLCLNETQRQTFEDFISHGFETELNKWEEKTETQLPSDTTLSAICKYINVQKLKEFGVYTTDEFEKMFAKKVGEHASDLALFLNKYEGTGILNFENDSKKDIFETLKAHFPSMKHYSYSNFAAAYTPLKIRKRE